MNASMKRKQLTGVEDRTDLWVPSGGGVWGHLDSSLPEEDAPQDLTG